jgi:acyl dehydratase
VRLCDQNCQEDDVLYAEDAAVGGEAPQRSHELTRTDLVRYAGASGDFNPMHHDEVLAKAAGMPSVFGHGMFSAGFLASALTDYVGEGALTRYAVRFTKQAWPGDVLQTKITITAVNGNSVDLTADLVTDKGVTVISGEASAQLPSKGGR